MQAFDGRGRPRRFIKTHTPAPKNESGERHPRWNGGLTTRAGRPAEYRPDHPRATRGGYVYAHILIAETALGKFISREHPIHHFDENMTNNANSNLVICEDHSYHSLLHARARILRAGGNPNTDSICTKCKQVKPVTEFYLERSAWNGRKATCVPCSAMLGRCRYMERSDGKVKRRNNWQQTPRRGLVYKLQ